ncbi:MAG TPA: MarR family transcriptional regulator [Gemmatimonadales bacterium]
MESASANTSAATTAPLFGPGLGETQRSILLLLKQLGPATQAEVGRQLPFAPATLREHLRTLTAHGLVQRQGSRRGKRGRPEVIYALTRRGDALFPHGEAAVLRDLVVHLAKHGHLELIEQFFAERAAVRRPAALARVCELIGAARFTEVARILADEGFMAQVDGTLGEPTLRICHCPIRDLVDVTQAPCRYEQALIAELLGQSLERIEYLPEGRASCLYREAAAISQPQTPLRLAGRRFARRDL